MNHKTFFLFEVYWITLIFGLCSWLSSHQTDDPFHYKFIGGGRVILRAVRDVFDKGTMVNPKVELGGVSLFCKYNRSIIHFFHRIVKSLQKSFNQVSKLYVMN